MKVTAQCKEGRRPEGGREVRKKERKKKKVRKLGLQRDLSLCKLSNLPEKNT